MSSQALSLYEERIGSTVLLALGTCLTLVTLIGVAHSGIVKETGYCPSSSRDLKLSSRSAARMLWTVPSCQLSITDEERGQHALPSETIWSNRTVGRPS